MQDVGKLQDDRTAEALARLGTFERQLLQKIEVYLATLTVQGVLSPTPAELATIRQRVIGWYQELNYANIVDTYIAALDEVDDINRAYYNSEIGSRARMRIENEIIKNPINTEYRNQVAENLRGAGAVEALVKPIEQLIRLDGIRGLTFEQAAIELQNLVSPAEAKGITQAKFEQVAKDALMQYDGLIQEEVRQVFKPTEGRYISSIIETTRPICDHIKDRFQNQIFKYADLQFILNDYCPGGTPSKDKITYETVNGVEVTRQKGSGMIEGTTLENFFINRGGYNCRHSWRWVF